MCKIYQNFTHTESVCPRHVSRKNDWKKNHGNIPTTITSFDKRNRNMEVIKFGRMQPLRRSWRENQPPSFNGTRSFILNLTSWKKCVLKSRNYVQRLYYNVDFIFYINLKKEISFYSFHWYFYVSNSWHDFIRQCTVLSFGNVLNIFSCEINLR